MSSMKRCFPGKTCSDVFLSTLYIIMNTLSGGKVASEKCAKLRRISGSYLDNHFVHIIRSRPQKMNKGDQLYSFSFRPQGEVKYSVPRLHVDFPIILYSD